MEAMSEQPVLVLSPTTHQNHVPGSVAMVADCGHACWIAPGSFKRLGEGMPTQCVDCFGGEAEIAKAIWSGEGVPADAGELRRAFDAFRRAGGQG